MFKFISLVLVIVFMMMFGNMSLLAAKANDAETHYFRGVEHHMHKQYHLATMEFGKALKLNPHYAEAQSAVKVAYAKAGGGNSLSLGYGALGVYQGAVFGTIVGGYVATKMDWGDNGYRLHYKPIIIGGAILGAAIGGCWGATTENKKAVTVGAITATLPVALMALLLYAYSADWID